jgi:4-hydroxymandelate oxidase
MDAFLTTADFETAAAAGLNPLYFDYYAGGSGDLTTLNRNRKAYGQLAVH